MLRYHTKKISMHKMFLEVLDVCVHHTDDLLLLLLLLLCQSVTEDHHEIHAGIFASDSQISASDAATSPFQISQARYQH